MIGIKLCGTCNGEGKVEDYGTRDWFFITCKSCNGHGRVHIVSIPDVTVPFDQEGIAIDIEEELLKIVRR